MIRGLGLGIGLGIGLGRRCLSSSKRSSRNAHQLLGLSLDDSKDVNKVKQAYYALAKEHHPDRGGDEEIGPNHDRFSEISKAYQICLDRIDPDLIVEQGSSMEKEERATPRKEFSSGSPDWGGYYFMMNFYQDSLADESSSPKEVLRHPKAAPLPTKTSKHANVPEEPSKYKD